MTLAPPPRVQCAWLPAAAAALAAAAAYRAGAMHDVAPRVQAGLAQAWATAVQFGHEHVLTPLRQLYASVRYNERQCASARVRVGLLGAGGVGRH